MKKALCIAVSAVALVAFTQTVKAEDSAPGKFGIGYQGTTSGDWANGISLRYAPKPLGAALVFSQLYENEQDSYGDSETWMLDLKCFYSLIQRENSEFYVGGSVGYLSEDDTGDNTDAPTLGVLVGAEWNFSELPEIGFNFEVGYKAAFIDDEDDNSDVMGTYASVGVHYYF